MKNPIILIVISMLLLCMYSCDNGKGVTTIDPVTPNEKCISAYFLKQAYYKVEFNKIKFEYEKDSTIQTALMKKLIEITDSIVSSCDSQHVFFCLGCPVSKPRNCDGDITGLADCVKEIIIRPECITSQIEIEFLKMVDDSGSPIGEADIEKGSFKNNHFEYPISYKYDKSYDRYTIDFKEKDSDIIYSVKFINK